MKQRACATCAECENYRPIPQCLSQPALLSSCLRTQPQWWCYQIELVLYYELLIPKNHLLRKSHHWQPCIQTQFLGSPAGALCPMVLENSTHVLGSSQLFIYNLRYKPLILWYSNTLRFIYNSFHLQILKHLPNIPLSGDTTPSMGNTPLQTNCQILRCLVIFCINNIGPIGSLQISHS